MKRSSTRLAPVPAPLPLGLALLLPLLWVPAGCGGAPGAPGRRGVVEGVLLDQNGRGIPGVAVALSGPAAAEVRTDGQGRYAFRRLASGDYQVSLRNPPGVAVPRPGTRSVTVRGSGAGRADFAVLAASLIRIAEIQGRGHLSPYAGREVVSLPAVVTALRAPAGFYVQSPLPDSSPDTSEGLFVAAARMPQLAPGDLLLVDGRIEERAAPGEPQSGLSVTTLVLTGHRRLGRGFDVPLPVVIGRGGRLPPDRIICNDAGGDVDSSPFDPAEDGLDFCESLEAMLVQVNEPLVVGTYDTETGTVEVVGDGGSGATTLTARGGLALLAGDQNPERITLDLDGGADAASQQPPHLAVGDRILGPVTGPLDYAGSTYVVLATRPLPQVSRASLPRQAASLGGDGATLTCAALNLQGFTAARLRDEAADLADTIVRGLGSPQIVAVAGMRGTMEAVADNGVSWEKAVRAMLEAIRSAGGPDTYRWRDLAPATDAAGAAFLYDRARVQLVERMGASQHASVVVREASGRPELSFSPGLIGVDDPAFSGGRNPLAAEFLFRGQKVFVVAASLSPGNGHQAEFGRSQPPHPPVDPRRLEQARALQRFAAAILSRDRGADVIVLGSFGDPAWAPTMQALKGSLLFDLAEQRLAPQERYTCVRRGNSVDLDHVYVSRSLLEAPEARLQILHRYSEYVPDGRRPQCDPLLAAFRFR